MMEFDLAELDRRLSNIVRGGLVAEVDLMTSPPMVRVDLGDMTTDWLPWAAGRAGRTRHWSPPDVNEQVLVLSIGGDLAQGTVLPGVFYDAFKANGAAQDLDRITYPDGSVVEYDSAAHRLTVTVGSGSVVVNCATATVNAQDSVTLDTPLVKCTKDLVVDGKATIKQLLTYQGGLAGSNSSGGAGASIQGGISLVGGDINADGYTLKGHHHTEQGDGAPTSAAQP